MPGARVPVSRIICMAQRALRVAGVVSALGERVVAVAAHALRRERAELPPLWQSWRRGRGAARSGCSDLERSNRAGAQRDLGVALTAAARRQRVVVDVVLAVAVQAQVAGARERPVVLVAALGRAGGRAGLYAKSPTSWSGLMSPKSVVEWQRSHAVCTGPGAPRARAWQPEAVGRARLEGLRRGGRVAAPRW